MGCLCDTYVPSPQEFESQLLDHEYISAFITKTKKNARTTHDSVIVQEYSQGQSCTVENVFRNKQKRALIKLRNESNYTSMCSNLAFLSIIDSTRLETIINNKSVYDNPQIHLPSTNTSLIQVKDVQIKKDIKKYYI